MFVLSVFSRHNAVNVDVHIVCLCVCMDSVMCEQLFQVFMVDICIL